MEKRNSKKWFGTICTLIMTIAALICIYEFFKKCSEDNYRNKIVALAEQLSNKSTIDYPDSLSRNEEIKHIVALQDQMKSSAREYISSISKRKELADLEVGPELASALIENTRDVCRPILILKESSFSINTVRNDLEQSTSKWNDAINDEILGEIGKDLDVAINELAICNKQIDELLSKPKISNDDIKKAVKILDSLYDNKQFLIVYESFFEWYNTLFDQLNGRISEIKNEQ